MKKLMLMAVLTAFAAAPALAGDNKSPAEKEAKIQSWIDRADANDDGMVSKDEFTADAAKKFDAIDANDDGQVSKDEKLAYKEDRKD